MSRPIARPAGRPNILIVMSDQHAARVLGAAGDPAAETPALDRLARSGTRFDTAYCSSPLCVPSRMAFLTGLEPHVSGVLSNDDFLPSDIPTFAHALGAVGYDCRLIGRMHFYGYDQLHGFADRPIGDIGPGWPGAGAPDIGPLTATRGNRGDQMQGSGVGETSYQAFDLAVAEAGIETLAGLCAARDAGGAPFLALVSLFCPHPPYIALPSDHDAVAEKVGPPRLDPPTTRHPALSDWADAGRVGDIGPDAALRARRAYYGLVRMTDRLAGRVIDAVSEREDTIVIYLSDHGEALGERGLWWKSTFFDESAKVPLIVAGPGVPQGAVDRRVTGLTDLTATLLDWAGADPLPEQSGRSWLAPGPWDDRALSSYYGGLMNIQTGALRHRMVRRGALKLCYYHGHESTLFDLESDPDEVHDLAADRPDMVGELLTELQLGWDAEALARRQHLTSARTRVIRNWVQSVAPEERLRWRDPHPERNRHL
ncbi:MAG: sulfatase-like hydrolase/transferase [Pseudomonadota bacterium]